MKNPVKNAFKSLVENPRHIIFAIYRRLPWLVPNDKLYLRIYYWLAIGKKLHLNPPVTYNEKLQWLKLYNHRPEYIKMVDKYLVKQYVASIIGDEYVIPTIAVWRNPDEIDWDSLPNQFVLKTNHDGGSNGIVVCKDKSKLNKGKALRELKHSFHRSSYLVGREWPYRFVKRCVFAEQYMEDSTTAELRDYKFFCFNGEVRALFIASNRGKTGDVKFDYFDVDFRHMDLVQVHPMSGLDIEKPKSFETMKHLASVLSQGIPHVRIDFYEVDGHPYFGEFTFFHHGGNVPFHPEKWDRIFGDWIALPEKTINN